MHIPLHRSCTAGIDPMRHWQFQRKVISAKIGEQIKERKYPCQHSTPSHRFGLPTVASPCRRSAIYAPISPLSS
jgi:hypothetical protein